jgi:queuine tRNA-ribosyltransferase
MHRIVSFTRSLVRDDRPVHLLGIGGVRDIFHGVRQGIDTFDCVHPTRLARHGGALVATAHWEEEVWIDTSYENPSYKAARDAYEARMKHNREQHEKQVAAALAEGRPAPSMPQKLLNPRKLRVMLPSVEKKPRENIDLCHSSMRVDPRPIEAGCACYTCRSFTRSYLHHLFKAKESLGGTLVTIHNIHFMNRLMNDIRRGILEDRLDEVEKKYVHPDLAESLRSDSRTLAVKGMAV